MPHCASDERTRAADVTDADDDTTGYRSPVNQTRLSACDESARNEYA